MDILTLRQGEDAVATITLASATGAALAFTGAEALTVQTWKGDDQANVTGATAAWNDAPDTVDVTYPAALTAALEAGSLYRGRLWIAGTICGADWLVKVLASAGVATALAVYTTVEDLLRLAPWIAELQADADQAGFTEARAAARQWLDDVILRHDSGDYAWPAGQGWPGSVRTGLRNQWLKEQLDADHLIITEPIRRACSAYALGQILAAQVGIGESPYAERASYFRRLAEDLVRTLTAEIDTDADGEGDYAVDLSVVDMLRG